MASKLIKRYADWVAKGNHYDHVQTGCLWVVVACAVLTDKIPGDLYLFGSIALSMAVISLFTYFVNLEFNRDTNEKE